MALQVREYEYDAGHQQESKAAGDSLRSEMQSKRSQLEEWSATAYGEVSGSSTVAHTAQTRTASARGQTCIACSLLTLPHHASQYHITFGTDQLQQ